MFFDNHKVSGVAGPLRFLMNFLPEEKRNADVIAFMTARLLGALKIMETQLADTPYLTGDALTIADIACAGYLFYPEPFGFDRSDFPHIDAWMTRIEDTPRWKHPYDLMPGSPADRA
jgi:glutathione S-transferase